MATHGSVLLARLMLLGASRVDVDAAQNHTKSNYMRNPPAAETFNEEVANLKRKIKSSVTSLDHLGISFDDDRSITTADADEILAKIVGLHHRAMRAAGSEAQPLPAEALRLLAAKLSKAFYGFEPDFFQQNLLRVAVEVVGGIKAATEMWPRPTEIVYFHKQRDGLRRRLANRKR